MTPREGVHLLQDVLSHIALAREAEVRIAAKSHDVDVEARLLYAALMYCLVVIGEAVRQRSDDTKAVRPDVPWRNIIGMRNALAHEYFRVDADVVAATLDTPLGQLESACLELLAINQT